MSEQQPNPESELDALIEAAGEEALDLIEAYEPIESVYRNAVTSPEVYPEASNTTGLPLALVVNASSAR